MDEGSKVEFTFEKDPKDHIQNVKKVKSIITKNGEKKEPETNENLHSKDIINQMIINKRNTKDFEKKINKVKVIKNFYIIVDEIDGKPIAKRVYKGEDGEEELNEDIEKYIKDKDQIHQRNKLKLQLKKKNIQ